MLLQTPNDLDLATLLREHALQYDGHDIALNEGQENIARGSLEYIERCGIPYLDHVHPQGTSKCIICEDWEDTEDASKFVHLDWQNDPQEDAAKFIPSSTPEAPSYASEIGAPPNEGTSNIVDLGWQNDPRVDTAVFFPTSAPDAPSYANEVSAPPIEGTSDFADMDWQNFIDLVLQDDPRADTAVFLLSLAPEAPSYTSEVGAPPNPNEGTSDFVDFDIVPIDPDARPGFSASSTLQIFGNSSSTLSSNLEASSVVELPAKLKRKRGELWSESRRVRVRQ
ncbi:hypothetical protein BJ912DRAFT_958845 [Pholiota molesta]|nr:hypothetical protein BJ912DRAFT_958845 [Pholiota molesta]